MAKGEKLTLSPFYCAINPDLKLRSAIPVVFAALVAGLLAAAAASVVEHVSAPAVVAAVAPRVLAVVVAVVAEDVPAPAVSVAAVPCVLVPADVTAADAPVPVGFVAVDLGVASAARDVLAPVVAAAAVLHVPVPFAVPVAAVPIPVVFAALVLVVLATVAASVVGLFPALVVFAAGPGVLGVVVV